jgi:hypothetical protein
MTHAYVVDAEAPVVAPPTLSFRRVGVRVVVAIVVVLLLAELAVRIAGDRLPPSGRWPTAEYASKVKQLHRLSKTGGAGVVAFGSSIIDVSFNPARLQPAASGKRGAYNAGILGTSPSVIAKWANLVVLPATRPDTVLLAVSSRDLNANGVATRGLDAEFLNAPEVRHLLGTDSFTQRMTRKAETVSQLVGHRELLRRPLQSYGVWHPDAFALELTKSGFDAELNDKTYRSDAKLRAYYRANLLHQFQLSTTESASLERFVRELRARGTRVVLVDVPVTQLYIDLHPRGQADMTDYRAAIDGVVKRTGAELVSFGVWPDALFSDPLHVNGKGSARLSDELNAYLAPHSHPPRGTPS